MLRGKQLQATVHQQQSVSGQINHAVKTHHQNNLYSNIDNRFVEAIESKPDANQHYASRMKALHMDQLDMGLQEYQRNKQISEFERDVERKDYRERVNGVLGEIEKNIMQRSHMFQGQLQRQEQKKKLFVDDNLRKERKISEHVNKNYDADIFHHESDRYQQHMANEHSQTLAFQEWQKQQSHIRAQNSRHQKQIEQQQRLEYEEYLYRLSMMEKQQKMNEQSKYKLDLSRMVDQKREQNRIRPEPKTQHRKHNPITNPIEYHVENPYILKRLQERGL